VGDGIFTQYGFFCGESSWIEKLTCIDILDLTTTGHTTAIIPAAGIEENGPCILLLNSQA